jgi:transposase
MSNAKKQDSGASEGARRATEDASESSASAGGGRWSAKRKVSVILELLRGADPESTSRKYRVTAATLSDWRDRFLAGGESILKSREVDVEDDEKRRLKSAVASLSVENELLREKIARLENGRLWRSGSRSHEPHHFAFQCQALWCGAGGVVMAPGAIQLLRGAPTSAATARATQARSQRLLRLPMLSASCRLLRACAS